MTELTSELDAVIRNLESRTWVQGAMERDEAVCAHGAVMTCKELTPGDEHIIRAVIRDQGLTESWNDAKGRTKEEVLERFRGVAVTDAALADTFGPQWTEVVALVRRAATLTEDEAEALAVGGAAGFLARGAARGAAWDAAAGEAAAGEAAWAAARAAARDAAAAQGAAWVAAPFGAEYAAPFGAEYAAGDAAQALAVRDLIGGFFTQAHYDALVGPWSSVIGKVHPDDAEELQ